MGRLHASDGPLGGRSWGGRGVEYVVPAFYSEVGIGQPIGRLMQ